MMNDTEDVLSTAASSKSCFVLIEYPGIVKNVDRALATLDGFNGITQATMTSGQLHLRHNPENVYQSALVADKKVMDEHFSGQVQLVVRVLRKRRKTNKSSTDTCNSEKNPIERVYCLGSVSMMFSFKSMCDFHYLPLRRLNGSKNLYEDLVPRLVPTDFLSAMTWFESSGANLVKDGDTPYFLSPSLYSRYTTSSTKIFGSVRDGDCQSNSIDNNAIDSSSSDLVLNSERKSAGHAKNLRSERKSHTVTVMGNEVFPMAPTTAAIKDVDMRIKLEGPHDMLIQMFTERPLWTRVALLQKTDLDDNVLKVILAKYAFYIASGPWGRCWCKFGYDPRQDSNAKQFQTIVVSFRDHKNIPERQRLKLSLSGVAATPNSVGPKELNQMIDFVYRPGVLPPVRQMWYCVCDILLPSAQKVLRKDFFAVLKECHESHGWLPPEIINSIRNAIKQDVQRITHLLESSEDYVLETGGLPGSDSADTSNVYHGNIDSSTLMDDVSIIYNDEENDDDDGNSAMDW